eukprot:7269578-Alexandrium_andersonii.AAC.1
MGSTSVSDTVDCVASSLDLGFSVWAPQQRWCLSVAAVSQSPCRQTQYFHSCCVHHRRVSAVSATAARHFLCSAYQCRAADASHLSSAC